VQYCVGATGGHCIGIHFFDILQTLNSISSYRIIEFNVATERQNKINYVITLKTQ